MDQDLSEQTDQIREYLQPLVLFGVFLVAVTILGVALSVILNLREPSDRHIPEWITDWGWILLLTTLSVGTLATAWVGFAAGFLIMRPYSRGRVIPKPEPFWKFRRSGNRRFGFGNRSGTQRG